MVKAGGSHVLSNEVVIGSTEHSCIFEKEHDLGATPLTLPKK